MVQIVVDPAAIGAPQETVSIQILPPALRRFGFVPDLDALLPGDLILFRSANPGIAQRAIAGAQSRAGFSDDDSRWTHAAVFLFGDLVVEAVPWSGVVQRSLYIDIPHKIWRVRRRTSLQDIDRHRIALRALSMLGARYSHRGAFELAAELFRGLWNPGDLTAHRNILICSEVFHDAYVTVTRGLLDGCRVGNTITPAHLSATPDLDDVAVEWLRLA